MLKRYILPFLLALVIPTQEAATADAAKSLVEGLGRKAIETLTSGKLSSDAQRTEFLSLLDQGFNVREIARFVMGKYWQGLSDSEKDRFVEKFRQDLGRQYANRFREFRGVTFQLKGGRETGDGGWFVQSTIKRSGEGAETGIEWKIYDGKIFDVKIEGVSMSQTKRDETYAAVQAKGGNPGAYISGNSGNSEAH